MLALLASCKTLSPERPEEFYLDLDYQPPLSVLSAPVEIPIPELQRKLNDQIQGDVYVDDDLDDDNLMLRVSRRNPIRVATSDAATEEAFRVTIPLHVWAKGGVSLKRFGLDLSKYEETEFDLNVKYDVRVQIDEQWQLRTQTTAQGFDWVKKPVLDLGGIRIEVAPFVEGVLKRQQRDIAKQIDQQVGQQVNLRPQAEQAWAAVQKPVLLSEAFDTWLRIHPTQALVSPLHVNEQVVQGQIGFRGYAETFTGKKPESTNEPLPALQTTDSVPTDFEIGLLGQISYAKAEELLRQEVEQQTFTSGSRAVRITHLNLYGSGENLVGALQLAGDVEGKVYLQGKPRYDPTTESIIIDDLDFSLDTRNQLAKAAAWLGRGQFLRELQEAFQFPIGAQIDTTRQQLQQLLDDHEPYPNMRINGELSQFQPGKIFITREGIKALVVARGRARLDIKGL
ncbi:protein of unknown function [Catalinimonas alkaloidigena]|uniref:DUF4403 family protein n=2 Tax=Catalinimonas alkaloidigena TaxID=1075417 RepID=A0A1G9QRJ1_9BACT|nr:protein of unknown function [Catalinimonas alkaloidigena]